MSSFYIIIRNFIHLVNARGCKSKIWSGGNLGQFSSVFLIKKMVLCKIKQIHRRKQLCNKNHSEKRAYHDLSKINRTTEFISGRMQIISYVSLAILFFTVYSV